ncbi:hypothetical protein AVEN_796-1 [Araneus ventricosus]|uniref:Uncharacterized protein n=1 Tax=Araneus ventricosus TaxID=182803 RepID=A0A4Y2MQK1_ARAVE|nr:hypothetical protein AVEN_796-1 [Araneus ventricosus]
MDRKVIRKKDEENDPSCYKRVVLKASSVMVWSCLAENGTDNLQFCTGTIKAPDYILVLEVNLRPSVQRLFGRKRYLFQQNSRRHTAKITKTWLRTKRVPVFGQQQARISFLSIIFGEFLRGIWPIVVPTIYNSYKII